MKWGLVFAFFFFLVAVHSSHAEDALQENATEETRIDHHPLYQHLAKKRQSTYFNRLFVGYHFDVLQLETNTAAPSKVGRGKMIPAMGVHVEIWAFRSWGVRLRWTKGLLFFVPDFDPSNKLFKTIDFVTPDFTYRYYFADTNQDSYVQIGLGLHYYEFPLVVAPSIPWVKSTYGPSLSIERKLAFNHKIGLRGAFDISPSLVVISPQQHLFSNQGLSLRFELEFYFTVMSDEDMHTHVGLVFTERDYIYRTRAEFRETHGKAHYLQTFRALQFRLAARL